MNKKEKLNVLKKELQRLYIVFNEVTDIDLIDACIYDIKSINIKIDRLIKNTNIH